METKHNRQTRKLSGPPPISTRTTQEKVTKLKTPIWHQVWTFAQIWKSLDLDVNYRTHSKQPQAWNEYFVKISTLMALATNLD